MTKQQPQAPQVKVRTHLANERTFLAWLRTGMTSVALGLAAAQLLADAPGAFGLPMNRLVAAGFVLLGASLVLIGRFRYRQAAIGLLEANYRPHRHGLDVATGFVIIIALGSLAFVARPLFD